MQETIKEEVQKIHAEFSQIEDKDHLKLYLLLKRFIAVMEIRGVDDFDDMFFHIYNEAKNLLRYPPEKNGFQRSPGIYRELDYLLPMTLANL